MTIAAGAKVDAGDFSFTPWTPTFNMVTLGTGATVTGWYTNVNKLVNGGFYLVFGTSPAFTGTIFVELPFTANVPGLQHALGSWLFRLSGSSHYSGTATGWDSGGTQMSFAGAWSGTAPNHRIGQTTTASPAAPVSGAILSAQFTYRAL